MCRVAVCDFRKSLKRPSPVLGGLENVYYNSKFSGQRITRPFQKLVFVGFGVSDEVDDSAPLLLDASVRSRSRQHGSSGTLGRYTLAYAPSRVEARFRGFATFGDVADGRALGQLEVRKVDAARARIARSAHRGRGTTPSLDRVHQNFRSLSLYYYFQSARRRGERMASE